MPRFLRRGKAKVRYLPTVAAATLVPTAIEVGAGTDLSPRVADMGGWQMESSPINTPDLATRFVTNIPGEQTVAASTLTFYADDAGTSDPIKTLLAVDVSGFVYVQHSGVGTGRPADTFPVRVSSIGNEYSLGNDAARYVVSFAITAEPAIDKPQA